MMSSFEELKMNFKKSLKRNQKKRAQIILEYIILVAISIIAIIAVEGIAKRLQGNPGTPGLTTGFDKHFKDIAAYAGGVIIP